MEQPMTYELPHAGEAAYKAAARGEPLVLANRGAAYSKSVEKIVRTIVPAEPKAAQRRKLSVISGGAQAPRAAAQRPTGGLFGALRGRRAS
jgi:hypothetical protein